MPLPEMAAGYFSGPCFGAWRSMTGWIVLAVMNGPFLRLSLPLEIDPASWARVSGVRGVWVWERGLYTHAPPVGFSGSRLQVNCESFGGVVWKGWNDHRGFLPKPPSLWIAYAANSLWRQSNRTAAKSPSVSRPSQSKSEPIPGGRTASPQFPVVLYEL